MRFASNGYPADHIRVFDYDSSNPAPEIVQPALKEQLPAARKKQCGIIAMKTFGGRPGLLVGRQKGRAGAKPLLRFALSQPIAVALAGMASQRQLTENLQTARNFKPLSEQETRDLYRQINSGEKAWGR